MATHRRRVHFRSVRALVKDHATIKHTTRRRLAPGLAARGIFKQLKACLIEGRNPRAGASGACVTSQAGSFDDNDGFERPLPSRRDRFDALAFLAREIVERPSNGHSPRVPCTVGVSAVFSAKMTTRRRAQETQRGGSSFFLRRGSRLHARVQIRNDAVSRVRVFSDDFPFDATRESREKERSLFSAPPPSATATLKPLALARVPAKRRRETDRRLM